MIHTRRFARRWGLVVGAAASALLFVATGKSVAAGQDLQRSPIVRVDTEQPFTLGVGQSAQVDSLKITFLRVLQDSRCPTDVYCFWAGDAEVELLLTHPETGRRRIVFHTTRGLRGAAVGQYRVRLNRLDPYPTSTSPIPQRAYRVTLRVLEGRRLQ